MKKNLLSLLVIICFCFNTNAQNMQQLKLWSAAESNGAEEAEIFVYSPAASTDPTPAVLICPGGGYGGLAMDHEGHDMAKWYIAHGYLAVVLKYTMPKGNHKLPLRDAEKAISTIRENAKKWNVDPQRVGVIGSSAGGHLAASLSTLAADANRPNFAILYYPVITFEDKITHGGTRQNLLGNDINNAELLTRYTLEKQVDDKTPRTLLVLSDDDTAVLPENGIRYYKALKEKGIPASMYIFPVGGHGWGFNDSFPYQKDVRTLIEKWLGTINN
jgi:acetyl esterase/lipase